MQCRQRFTTTLSSFVKQDVQDKFAKEGITTVFDFVTSDMSALSIKTGTSIVVSIIYF